MKKELSEMLTYLKSEEGEKSLWKSGLLTMKLLKQMNLNNIRTNLKKC